MASRPLQQVGWPFPPKRCQLYLRRFMAMTRWFSRSAVLLLCLPFCFAQQPAKNSEAAMSGLPTYEQHKPAAIRINELAGRIHSEADANALVSEIAGVFVKELPSAWVVSGQPESRPCRIRVCSQSGETCLRATSCRCVEPVGARDRSTGRGACHYCRDS
jgi:hypothetical protein